MKEKSGIADNKKIKNSKYTWRCWCIIAAVITALAFAALLAGLSVMAVVYDIKLITYENKGEGVVSAAEYNGGEWVSNANGVGESRKFDEAYYVIGFDEETADSDRYEYRASNIITSEKRIGERYVVLFNGFDNIKKPVVIRKSNIIIGNAALAVFVILLISALVFRKRIYRACKNLSEKIDGTYVRHADGKN